jgi:hypothetical protein
VRKITLTYSADHPKPEGTARPRAQGGKPEKSTTADARRVGGNSKISGPFKNKCEKVFPNFSSTVRHLADKKSRLCDFLCDFPMLLRRRTAPQWTCQVLHFAAASLTTTALRSALPEERLHGRRFNRWKPHSWAKLTSMWRPGFKLNEPAKLLQMEGAGMIAGFLGQPASKSFSRRMQAYAGRVLVAMFATAVAAVPVSIGGRQIVSSAQAQGLPTAIEALRPIRGVSYDPAPSDDPLGENGGVPGGPAANRSFVYEDSDFFNDDFKALWGNDGNPGSRQDLQTMNAAGVNFLHLYNWNPARNHDGFLNAADAAGIKVMIPISNFTASLTDASCCGINPATAGFNAAFNNVSAIFNQVYPNNGTIPHPGAKVWGIMNEFDFEHAGAEKVAFIIQSLFKLEQQRGVTANNLLPIAVPVSFARRDLQNYQVDGAQQPAIFAQAEALYHQTHPGQRPPGGVLSIIALSIAFQNAQTTYRRGSETPVTVPAFPADFWTSRFIAVVNPFVEGPDVNTYLTDPSTGFQSAFPGTSAWNKLPAMFFGEYGVNRDASRGDAAQAAFVASQMNCVFPLALDTSTLPSKYFLGVNAFEFSPVCKNKLWDIFGFTGNGSTADPLQGPGCAGIAIALNQTCIDPVTTQCASATPQPSTFTMHKTSQGYGYRVDTLIPFQEWTSFKNGFLQTSVKCP